MHVRPRVAFGVPPTVFLFCMERSKSHRTNGISRHPCGGFLFIFLIFFIFVYNRLWRCADDRLCPPDGIFRSTLHVDASGVYREHPHQHIGAISSCPLPPPYKNDLSCHPVRGVLLSHFTSLQPTSHVSATVARFPSTSRCSFVRPDYFSSDHSLQ
jgi:hypothetical protein